jgi:hypothetical protein
MMGPHVSAALVAAGLLVSPAALGAAAMPVDDPSGSSQVSDAQAFSIVAGQILGAASACDQIEKERVSAATEKAAGIAAETADDEDDAAAAKDLMIGAAAKGQKAVEQGDADCGAVQLSFAKLEQIENQGEEMEQQGQLEEPDQDKADQDRGRQARPDMPHAGE